VIVVVDGGKEIVVDGGVVRVVLGTGQERHITVTHEGVVERLLDGDEVVRTAVFTHDELLPGAEDWPV